MGRVLRHVGEAGLDAHDVPAQGGRGGHRQGQRQEICRGLHAEQNAIIQAARYGIDIRDSKIYITTQPCITCAKMCINAGINEIIYANPYPDELSLGMLDEAGVPYRVYELPQE